MLFQDQSELILCSGSGYVTFVNAKKQIKTVPLNNTNRNLEQEDPSLFKRLQYAKEVLVQMMTTGSATQAAAVAQVNKNLGISQDAMPEQQTAESPLRQTEKLMSSSRQTLTSSLTAGATPNTRNTELRHVKTTSNVLTSSMTLAQS